MHLNFNKAIKEITRQENDVRMICYQTNVVTKGSKYRQDNYHAKETLAPESQMELIRDDTLFWASCPVYPFSFVRENLHICDTTNLLQESFPLRHLSLIMIFISHLMCHVHHYVSTPFLSIKQNIMDLA